MRNFSFGELWGPAPCHVCGKYDYITQLSDDDEREIAGLDGPSAARVIISQKLGKPVCYEHSAFTKEK